MGSLAQTFTFVPSGKEKALSSALGGFASVVDSVLGSSGNSSAYQTNHQQIQGRRKLHIIYSIKLKNSVKRTIEIKLNQWEHFKFAKLWRKRFFLFL